MSQQSKETNILTEIYESEKHAKTLSKQLVQTSQNKQQIWNTTDIDELKVEAKALYEEWIEQENRIKKLSFGLEVERGHNAVAEQEEEFISNKLLKRITKLKNEKSELLVLVEQEEEYMTNKLQKKLIRLERETIEMENALGQEQETIVNRLQKQLDSLKTRDLSASSSPVISRKPSREAVDINTTDMLISEIASLKSKTSEMEREFFNKLQQSNKYKAELIQLRKKASLGTDDIPIDEE